MYTDVEVGLGDPTSSELCATSPGSESLTWICPAVHVVSGARLAAGGGGPAVVHALAPGVGVHGCHDVTAIQEVGLDNQSPPSCLVL